MNFKATLSFNGTTYKGWQLQKNGVTIQEKVEEALKKIHGKRVIVHGASRTDTGVHALGMVISFQWTKKLAVPELQRALNALLPDDIRILHLEAVKKTFHARFNAKSKLYRYRILNRAMNDPFRKEFTWFTHRTLNLAAMRKAARFFVGKHDFSSFAANPGYERTSMVRTIFKSRILRKNDEIHFEVEGDGFLYKMVRTMVGTLVEVGTGKRKPESIKELLKNRNRDRAGVTAPAHGLFLVSVKY